MTQIKLWSEHCWKDMWASVGGAYWAYSGGGSSSGTVQMSYYSNNVPCPGGSDESHRIARGRSANFIFGEQKYKVTMIEPSSRHATVDIIKISNQVNEDPDVTKAQILTVRSDKLGYKVGDIIKSECTIKNIGGAGTIYLTVGLGYLDSSDMIFLTGFPISDQLFLRYQQFYTFKEDIKVDITDYYRQRGIGWAYLQQQIYLFFLVGHKVNESMVWDTEKHIKIYIDEPESFKDPTDLDESIIGDVVDVVDDAIPAFGGLGGLKWGYNRVKDIEHIPDWIADTLRGEDKEEKEPLDITPFLYIGFAGLIGYMLVRSM